MWQGTYHLPHEYDRLSSAGRPVTLHVDVCARGRNGARAMTCDVTDEATWHTWTYPVDTAQLTPYVGGSVSALADPDHPDTVYTVHDVQTRFGAGFTQPGVVFGVVMLVVGVGLLAFTGTLARLLGRPRRRS